MPSNVDRGQPESLTFFVAAESDVAEDTMGLFRRGGRDMTLRDIPVAVLRDNMRRAVSGLKVVFDDAAAEAGRLPLREAHIQFEVSAKGGIQIVGTSEIGARGAITLVFGS